jgi:hypothetical protein
MSVHRISLGPYQFSGSGWNTPEGGSTYLKILSGKRIFSLIRAGS